MLPQHWSDQDYCFLVSVIGVKPRQLHQMADSTNPSLGEYVIQWYYLWGYSKNYWGFQGYSPFHCCWLDFVASTLYTRSFTLVVTSFTNWNQTCFRWYSWLDDNCTEFTFFYFSRCYETQCKFFAFWVVLWTLHGHVNNHIDFNKKRSRLARQSTAK